MDITLVYGTNISDSNSDGCTIMKIHDILGLEGNATLAEIKSAFRVYVKNNHPDTNPDDPEAERRTQEAISAYKAYCVNRGNAESFWNDVDWSDEYRWPEEYYNSYTKNGVTTTIKKTKEYMMTTFRFADKADDDPKSISDK